VAASEPTFDDLLRELAGHTDPADPSYADHLGRARAALDRMDGDRQLEAARRLVETLGVESR
jgi:hypothetical protein